jgi:hypothetical protein
MAKEIANPLFDRRVIERNLRTGAVDRKEYERWLKALDDDSDNAAPVNTALGSSGQTPKGSESDEEV